MDFQPGSSNQPLSVTLSPVPPPKKSGWHLLTGILGHILLIGLLMFATLFIAPWILMIQSLVFHGESYDFGPFGLGVGIIFPAVFVVPIFTYLLSFAIKKWFIPNFRYGVFFLSYVIALGLFINPLSLSAIWFLAGHTVLPVVLAPQIKEQNDTFRGYNFSETDSGIKQYYKDHQKYPAILRDIVVVSDVCDPSDSNDRSCKADSIKENVPRDPVFGDSYLYVGDEVAQDKFFEGINYTVSSDLQQYVLYMPIQSSKSKILDEIPDSLNAPRPMLADGIILGINCSDAKIFCVSDTSNSSLPR